MNVNNFYCRANKAFKRCTDGNGYFWDGKCKTNNVYSSPFTQNLIGWRYSNVQHIKMSLRPATGKILKCSEHFLS